MIQKHFVTFYSPGTFFAESTTKPIDSWDVDAALKMAGKISERYGATPYGFKFSTRTRNDDDLDSKVSASSGMHYFNCYVETVDVVRERADPRESILLSNMECNHYDRVVRGPANGEGWAWTQPFTDADTIVAATSQPTALNSDPQSDGNAQSASTNQPLEAK